MNDMHPGSPEAVATGCTCPVLDNASGRGIPGSDLETGVTWTTWWRSGDCPLHGEEALRREEMDRR